MRRISVSFELVYLLLLWALPTGPLVGRLEASNGGHRDLVIEELKESSGLDREASLWVLAIGVSQYQDESISLKYADHDASTIAQLLESQQGLLFAEVHTRVLTNEQATKRHILMEVESFLGQATKGDVVVIFMAGHGMKERNTDTYYFVPYDANLESLFYDGLAMPAFEEACKRIESRVDKLVLLMDTCHAGALEVNARGVNAGEDLSEALARAKGRYILSASEGGELSFEHEDYRFKNERRGHGGFTYSLMRGLLGGAVDERGVVWISRLFGHVSRDVPKLTQARQHPHSQIQGSDLPLFILRDKAESGTSAEAAVPIDQILLPRIARRGRVHPYLELGYNLAASEQTLGIMVGGYRLLGNRKTFCGVGVGGLDVPYLEDTSVRRLANEGGRFAPDHLLSPSLIVLHFFRTDRTGFFLRGNLGMALGRRDYEALETHIERHELVGGDELILRTRTELNVGFASQIGLGFSIPLAPLGLPVGRGTRLVLGGDFRSYRTRDTGGSYEFVPRDSAKEEIEYSVGGVSDHFFSVSAGILY